MFKVTAYKNSSEVSEKLKTVFDYVNLLICYNNNFRV